VKKIAVVLLAIMLLLLSGSSYKEFTRYNYFYKGESALWTAEYAVTGTGTWTEENNRLHYGNDIKEVLTVTYKNDVSELSGANNLKIEYDVGAGGGSLNEYYDSNNHLTKRTFKMQGGGKNISVPLKDSIVHVKVTLDNNVQSLELKNAN